MNRLVYITSKLNKEIIKCKIPIRKIKKQKEIMAGYEATKKYDKYQNQKQTIF